MKGYWIICVQSYEIEGFEVCLGHMRWHDSDRPVMNNKWRRATQPEVENMKRNDKNGVYYYHEQTPKP